MVRSKSLILLVALFAAGCPLQTLKRDSQTLEMERNDPELAYFFKVTSDSAHLIGRGIGESEKESKAFEESKRKAMNDIGSSIVTHIDIQRESLEQEITSSEYSANGVLSEKADLKTLFKNASRQASEVVLSGAHVSKVIPKKYYNERSKKVIHKFYTVVVYPKKAVDQVVLDWIQKKQLAYETRLDSLQTYKKLLENKQEWVSKGNIEWQQRKEREVPKYLQDDLETEVQALRAQVAKLSRTNRIKILDGIYFAIGVVEVTHPRYRKRNTTLLNDLISYLRELDYSYILIIGHADTSTPTDGRDNFTYARQRAKSCKDYLRENGIEVDIQTIGVGTLQNIAANGNSFYNRRCEVFIVL